MHRRILATAAALVLGAIALPAEAQQRTRLTVYTALENEQLAPFKTAAEAAVRDIEIAWVRDSTGVMTARLLAERANPRADVVWGLSAFSLLQMEALDMLEPYTPRGAEALRPNMRSDRSPMTWTGMDAFVATICHNTVIARQRNLPRPSTWADLLNPALRGQITMPNPASSGTGFLTVAGWIQSMGEERAWQFMNSLHENIQVYTHSGSAPCNNAARGEYGMGISLDMRAVTLRNQGAPIDIIVPTDGVGFDLEATAIMRGTRNLDAARRLADFAVSRAAMEVYGRFYALLALPGVTASVQGYPADFEQRLVNVNFREMGAQRERILAEWTRRFDNKSAPGTERAMLQLRDAFLKVEGLGRDFGRFTAMQDIQLEVAQGEFLCLLGPSGCGKTTLLRAIAGLDTPSRGKIFQGGQEITRLPPSRRDFGIVFQSYALFPNMTVAANVGYGLRGPAWPRVRAEQRVTELLEMVGLSAQAQRYPAQISGGQQQRVALARALANEPGLLLLDEPLSALDAIVRLHLRQELRSVQRRLGVTTVMVTHDQEEALSLADRVAVMDRGRVMQVGTPQEVYATPANPFVASFVGRSASFEAVVEGDGLRLADGTHLPARAAHRHPEGSRARVFIRPEDVALGGESALMGELRGIEYLGPVCRLELHAAGLDLHAEIAPRELHGIALGERMPVTLPPDKLMVFAADV